jgi:hypothetical protein
VYPTDDLRHFGGNKNILPLSGNEQLFRCLPQSIVTTHATLAQHGTKETNRSGNINIQDWPSIKCLSRYNYVQSCKDRQSNCIIVNDTNVKFIGRVSQTQL